MIVRRLVSSNGKGREGDIDTLAANSRREARRERVPSPQKVSAEHNFSKLENAVVFESSFCTVAVVFEQLL